MYKLLKKDKNEKQKKYAIDGTFMSLEKASLRWARYSSPHNTVVI